MGVEPVVDRLFRVAIASSDGSRVDQHFGWATRFEIYDVWGGGFFHVDSRLRQNPSCGGDCASDANPLASADALEESALLLKDCSVLLTSRIGPGPSAYLEAKGLRIFQVSLPTEEALSKLISAADWLGSR